MSKSREAGIATSLNSKKFLLTHSNCIVLPLLLAESMGDKEQREKNLRLEIILRKWDFINNYLSFS